MGWIRKTRICLVSTMAVLLIILAVAFTLLRAVLPHATGYLTDIEQGISQQIGLSVSIGSLDADMYYFTPRLKLVDLTIYKDDGVSILLHLKEAYISLAIVDSIRHMMPMAGSVSLHGVDISIERHPEGKWVVQGFAFQQGGSSEDSSELIDLVLGMNLALFDSRIQWRDFTGRSKNMDFDDVTVLLENEFDTQYVEIDLDLPDWLGSSMQVVAEINGDIHQPENIDAFVHLSGRSLVVENWVESTRIKEFIKGSGVIDTDLWFHINKKSVTRISGKLSADDLVLKKFNDLSKTWSANHVDSSFYWRELGDNWRLDVRELNLKLADSFWRESSDIIVAKHEDDWRILASYIKPGDLLPIVNILPDAVQIPSAEKYYAYDIDGEIINLEAIFTDKGDLDLDFYAAFDDLQFSIPGKNVSISGFDGELRIDGMNAELQLTTRDAQIELSDLFRWPIQLTTIDGMININVEGETINVMADELVASNDHISSMSRINVELSADNKLFLDMQTNFENGKAKPAYRYIPSGILSKGLVDWLDNAFIDGYVSSGGFLFRGIANEYPFSDNEGVMEALFDVQNGKLHFLDGWPDVNNVSGTVLFHNASLNVEHARSIEDHGGEATVNASIPDLQDALLSVSGKVVAPADELQQYVWNSGLDGIVGRPIEHFQVSGNSQVNFRVDVPLGTRREREGGEITASGDITFTDNELFFPTMDYLVTDLSGKLMFTTHSLSGKDITGNFYGQPVQIDVSNNQDSNRPETLFNISGNWHVNSLLKKYDWDAPSILDGTSYWTAVVHVPHKVIDYGVMFDISSNLVGVTIGFSDNISKSANEAVPLSINLEILGDAQSLVVRSPDILRLTANKDEEDYWRFNIDSPYIAGNGKIQAELDVSSTIQLDLDLLHLSAFVKGDGKNAELLKIKASSVPSIKLKTRSLIWHDWQFNNVSFATDQHSRGMVINEIKIDDPFIQVSGKGSWLRRSWRLDEETTLSFRLSSGNMGDMLQKLGYSRFVDKSSMNATLNWSWPGEPYSFNWEKLTGNTTIELGHGVISEIEPGAGGRFLGLFNLLHLPKRLILDFEDVYKEGFVFDSMKGSYIFGDGDAVTQDTEIKAAAADITMMGRIGFTDRDYDMVSIVRPQSTVATFAGGTLVGGPTVGLGLVLLQKVFGLDLLGKNVYSIEGSWDSPVITQISGITSSDGPVEDEADEFQ